MRTYKRLPKWESLFADWVEFAQRTPFKWGENDCALHAANCVLAITGSDPGEDFRGKYKTEIGAGRALLERGFKSLEEVGDDRLGPRVSINHARRGDIILGELNTGTTMLVCLGGELLAATKYGGQVLQRSEVNHKAIWRIG
jgi:hypothetical protein